jgi:phosphoglycerate kinase
VGFNKKTVEDVEVHGKVVLLRTDYNVPIDAAGRITDAFRVTRSVPTIQYLLSHGAQKVVIVSHLGRPEGRINSRLSLAPVAAVLKNELPSVNVVFANFLPGVMGDGSEFLANMTATPVGSVVMLENLRFNPGEEQNSEEFARSLVQVTGADIFVQDGFAVLHRESATTNAITRLLPSVAGLLVIREVSALQQAIYNPVRPFLSINGGAKISDKIGVLEKLMEVSEGMLIGGAMANTFLQYSGLNVGASKVELGQGATLNAIYAAKTARNVQLLVPKDVAVVREIAPNAKVDIKSVSAVGSHDIIVDIGPRTAELFTSMIHEANTIFWNGTLGITEYAQFSSGSRAVAEAIGYKRNGLTIIGGGDTAGFVRSLMLSNRNLDYSLISTGGGVTLDFIASKPLPGLAGLQDR